MITKTISIPNTLGKYWKLRNTQECEHHSRNTLPSTLTQYAEKKAQQIHTEAEWIPLTQETHYS